MIHSTINERSLLPCCAIELLIWFLVNCILFVNVSEFEVTVDVLKEPLPTEPLYRHVTYI